MEQFTFTYQLLPFQSEMVEPSTSTPCDWIVWTKLVEQKSNDDDSIKIPLEPGVYEVRAIFEEQEFDDCPLLRDRLYIGSSSGEAASDHQSLNERIPNLLREGGISHSHHERVRRYAEVFFKAPSNKEYLKENNIAKYTDLLQIRWWKCGAPELLERQLHKQYDPLFPDKSITHVKVLFSSKEQLANLSKEEQKKKREQEKDIVQRALYIKNLKESPSKEGFIAWLQEEPVLSERNAERYLKLAQWHQESNWGC